MKPLRVLCALLCALCVETGCVNVASAPMRVATYNIRQSGCDRDTPNAWDARKADLIALVRKIAPDVFGSQEVLPDQAEYLRETLTEFDFAGEHRNKDRVSGEASPVLYRKNRFEALDASLAFLVGFVSTRHVLCGPVALEGGAPSLVIRFDSNLGITGKSTPSS